MHTEWQRWDYRKARSSIMRNAALEERAGYRRKTWGEEWLHRLDDPEIRAHVAACTLKRQAAQTDPAEFFGVVFGLDTLRGELQACDYYRQLDRALTNLKDLAKSLRHLFQPPPRPEPRVSVSVAKPASPKKQRWLQNRPPLSQQLITPVPPRSPNWWLTCSDV